MSEPLEELRRLRNAASEQVLAGIRGEERPMDSFWSAYLATLKEGIDAIIAALEEREKARAEVVAEMRAAVAKNRVDGGYFTLEWADRLEGK